MFRFEDGYWWYRGLHELVRSYVDIHKKQKGKGPLVIFDAGCGTGRMMELLDSYGTVTGIDLSEDAIALCRERGVKNAATGDLNTWDGEPDYYDVIISNDVIYNAGVEDDNAVVRKFYRALKPGGIMILNLPAFELLRRRHDIAVSGIRRYRKQKTLKQLKTVGFKTVRCGYRLAPLFVVMLLQKILVEPFQKGDPASDLNPLPSPINRLLLAFHRLDNHLFRAGLSLPLGSSLFVVCRK
jgi:SAM-dependent methyltransferase